MTNTVAKKNKTSKKPLVKPAKLWAKYRYRILNICNIYAK